MLPLVAVVCTEILRAPDEFELKVLFRWSWTPFYQKKNDDDDQLKTEDFASPVNLWRS